MAGQGCITISGHEWLVDLALSPWELEQGLGGLPQLATGTGMLFDLGLEQTMTVTTVPMLFPLDIAFLSESLVVTQVYRNIEPGYLVTSTLPARYFLEVNAGELVNIDAGDPVILEILSVQDSSSVPDWTSTIIGFMSFMAMGVFLVGMVRNITGEVNSEPDKKPLIYGPRGEVLLAKTTPGVDLWNEIALTIQRSLGQRTELPMGECQRIAEDVAGRIEKRAGQLAWLELQNGTTFERVGKAPVNQGLRIFAAVDGYLGIGSDLWHADRVAIAELVNDALMTAEEIRLRGGTVFRKTFVPGQGKVRSAAVIPKDHDQSKRHDTLDLLPDSPEYLAYTIDDIGFRDIIDSAFLEAINRARRFR